MSELFTLRRATVCLVVAANNEHRRAPCSHTIVFFFFGAVKTFKVELRYEKKYNKREKESFHLKNVLQFSIAYIFLESEREHTTAAAANTYVILLRVKLFFFFAKLGPLTSRVHNMLFIEKEEKRESERYRLEFRKKTQ